MQRQQAEYASQSSPSEHFAKKNAPQRSVKIHQRLTLAAVSLVLWTLVSYFVLWNNSGNLGTFSFTEYTFDAQTEHFLLIFGLIIFTCLLLFVNIIFRPSQDTILSSTDKEEKLHIKSSIFQRLKNNKKLFTTLGSLILWIAAFTTTVWQLSDHPLAFVHYIAYNQTGFTYFQDQIIDAWIVLFVIISFLLFFLNERLYRQNTKKKYER